VQKLDFMTIFMVVTKL